MGEGKNKKTETVESPKPAEVKPTETKPAETPKPKFTGPLIAFRNIEIKAGGVVSVQSLDDRVKFGKIQIIQIKSGDANYVYRRI